MPDFLSLGVSEKLVGKLQEYGVVTPTPIQEQAIPFLMNGQDIIAQAQTGTGKTFAFILPILERINPNATHTQALIVTPTRELALQITNEIKKMIDDIEGIDVLAVYGGQDVDKQLKKLKKNVQIVVGTPGRLIDHIRRGTIQLADVSFLVLDEADQMLHIGFIAEVEVIIKETPASRQTMLFSATIPAEIRTLAKKHMRSPEYIQVEKTQGPAQSVKQLAIHTTDRAKQATLIELIEAHRPFLAVIFCRTKRRVSKLYDALKGHGFTCDELHGDLSQAKREQVMKRFRDAEVQLLIATDVAARGLDVEGVTHVYNYDIPQDSESFVHRIGRTGRAGMEGMAITFYSTNDRPTLDMIEEELNITIQKQNIGNISNTVEDNGNKPKKTLARSNNPRTTKRDRSGGPRRDKRGEIIKSKLGGTRRERPGEIRSNEKSDETRRDNRGGTRRERPGELRSSEKSGEIRRESRGELRKDRPVETRSEVRGEPRRGRLGETRRDNRGETRDTRAQRGKTDSGFKGSLERPKKDRPTFKSGSGKNSLKTGQGKNRKR